VLRFWKLQQNGRMEDAVSCTLMHQKCNARPTSTAMPAIRLCCVLIRHNINMLIRQDTYRHSQHFYLKMLGRLP
jgi:hypothetical protein